MAVVKSLSPEDLLEALYGLQSDRFSGQWIFRGQANARWRLQPSLFRQNLKNEREFEANVLSRLRSDLSRRSLVPDRLLGDDNYLLAMAQHYGCPTRMLDWSLSPLYAAYFAASDALRFRSEEPLAVFAIAEVTSGAGHVQGSQLVRPPSGANENLAAQSGILCKHAWSCRDYWQEEFNQPVTESRAEITALIEDRFIRFELPVERAGELVSEVALRGIDGATAFPGASGLVRNAIDYGLGRDS